jgi:phospholipid/cholesterol/gamma-HCH transport system ATP-binding protein
MTGTPQSRAADGAAIEVRDLTMTYGSLVIMRDVSFTVRRGEIFVIMGGSGSGKSTLLKHLIGLKQPARGAILFDGEDFGAADESTRKGVLSRMGVLYQNGALWSGLKLALVGLRGFEGFYPAEISGGMRKRAALARAIALDPDVLFFDEPSSGLDPVSASRLDDLILELKASFGTTIVVVTHDLASIFRIADRALFLDIEQKTMTALGSPAALRDDPPTREVRQFLTRSSRGQP